MKGVQSSGFNQENRQIDGVLYATIHVWSKFREVLLENQANLQLDNLLLGFWKVMNIIARRYSSCVLVPPSLDFGEQMLWERSTHEDGTC